ncbi:MAG: vitamin K epoxide reductase family protein, partial [Proteobacteria bacterium]|nr:vitamin K epoxide reductase family protein [Pseudomonadota bacterium]
MIVTTGFLWFATVAGFILSLMDMMGICSDACSETAKYNIFGLNFALFGLVFFTVVLLSLALRNRLPLAGFVLPLMLFGAAGAELHFIWLQKYEIGKWCPICLTIAAMVYLGCGVLLYETLRSETVRTNFKRITIMVVALVVGVTAATFGVAKESQASLDFFLGKEKSPITVYFISDWFCPVCQKVEPRIEQIYTQVAKEARVAFI